MGKFVENFSVYKQDQDSIAKKVRLNCRGHILPRRRDWTTILVEPSKAGTYDPSAISASISRNLSKL